MTTVLLRKRNLSVKEKNSLIVHIMDNLQSLPISSIISTNEEGETLLNGRSLDLEKAQQLRESARQALDNVALKVVNHEVLYTAVTMGVHKVQEPVELLFARAAIWYGQQQEVHLKILAQRTEI